jgi:hypothetical protein
MAGLLWDSSAVAESGDRRHGGWRWMGFFERHFEVRFAERLEGRTLDHMIFRKLIRCPITIALTKFLGVKSFSLSTRCLHNKKGVNLVLANSLISW